jgi:ABC-type phosphate transport system substrate-binding protein
LLTALPGNALAQEVVLISNADVPVSNLTKDEIKRIFLGKQTTLGEEGTDIVFAVQHKTEASKQFLKEYIRKSVYQYSIYWKKRVFAGKGKAPVTFSSDQEIAAFVSKTPGAIGYVSTGTDIGNAKIILVQ